MINNINDQNLFCQMCLVSTTYYFVLNSKCLLDYTNVISSNKYDRGILKSRIYIKKIVETGIFCYYLKKALIVFVSQ